MLVVIENAKQFIDNKEEIPDQILVQLIKGKIMMIKAVEMEKSAKRVARLRQREDVVAAAGNATATGKAKSPTGKKSPTKAAPAAGKKPSGPGASDSTKQTNLKKKEEEDDEKFLGKNRLVGFLSWININCWWCRWRAQGRTGSLYNSLWFLLAWFV